MGAGAVPPPCGGLDYPPRHPPWIDADIWERCAEDGAGLVRSGGGTTGRTLDVEESDNYEQVWDFAHLSHTVTEAPASQTITGGPATGFGPSTTVIPPRRSDEQSFASSRGGTQQ